MYDHEMPSQAAYPFAPDRSLAIAIFTLIPEGSRISYLIGFRLYAIAELPIWSFSNGSSTSFKFASSRISVAILCAVAPKDAKGAKTSMSTFRL